MSKRVIAIIAVGIAVVLGGVIFAVSDGGDAGRKASIADDPPPDDGRVHLTVGDATIIEGSGGMTSMKTMRFHVAIRCFSCNYTSGTFNYHTENDSATAPDDFESQSGSVSDSPYDGTPGDAYITVNVRGDTQIEPDEKFRVVLDSSRGDYVVDSSGTGTIVNDDGPTTLSVSDANVYEGNSGYTPMTFKITRTGAGVTGTSSVHYETVDGTAIAGSDYYYYRGEHTETFSPGETERPVEIAVGGDTVLEDAERFTLKLTSPSGATIADESGTGRIDNDDPGFRISGSSVTEGSPSDQGTRYISFVIERLGPLNDTASVSFATQHGTAYAPTDYQEYPTTPITFKPGESAKKVVKVQVNGDTTPEPNEILMGTITNPSNGTVMGKSSVSGQIINDD